MRGYTCSVCGQYHDDLPRAFGAAVPYSYACLPEGDRESRARISSDQCIIDETQFFVRGCLEIPIRGTDEHFEWGVWVQVSEADFRRMSDLWEQEGREAEPPYSGVLDTLLPIYPNTQGLAVKLRTRPVGLRPSIDLEPVDHPLAREQQGGLTWQRLVAIASTLMHGAS